MPRKPIDLPADVALAFLEDMRAFFAEPNAIKRDEIAARQVRALPTANARENLDHERKSNFEKAS
jgi:hypothetical protein